MRKLANFSITALAAVLLSTTSWTPPAYATSSETAQLQYSDAFGHFVSLILTIQPTATPGQYQVTNVTGTWGGIPVTGLATSGFLGSPSNLIFDPPSFVVDTTGLGFTIGGTDILFRSFTSFGGGYATDFGSFSQFGGSGAATLLGSRVLTMPSGASAISSAVCSPNSPAQISGSTGEQGVLDPTNANPALGLVWPAGAVQASILLDTGVVTFLDSNGRAFLTGAPLPGTTGGPSGLSNGTMNFLAVHLTPGTTTSVTTNTIGLSQPVVLLSCQDVILDSGSTLSASTSPSLAPSNGPEAAGFLGGTGPGVGGGGAAGFGPRTGPTPSAGSLYPAVGGGGGNGGTQAGGNGGGGGSAIVISAAQRLTINGSLDAGGLAGSSSGAQGGAGGSVRLAALLTDGAGAINTSGGPDSDAVVRSPSGPVEVQAFIQDFFSGTTSTPSIRGNAPVQPVPANLPVISLDQINAPALQFQQFEISHSGSLTAPDVILPSSSTAQVSITVSLSTQNILDGTILVFRAVGTDGSVSTASATLSGAAAAANLTLNAGATYQIVVTPNTPFPSLGKDPDQLAALSGGAGTRARAFMNAGGEIPTVLSTSASVSSQMKMFGMPDPDIIADSGLKESLH